MRRRRSNTGARIGAGTRGIGVAVAVAPVGDGDGAASVDAIGTGAAGASVAIAGAYGSAKLLRTSGSPYAAARSCKPVIVRDGARLWPLFSVCRVLPSLVIPTIVHWPLSWRQA